MLELLHVEPGRLGGAPRLYVFRSCRNLIAQLQSAPVAAEGVGAGITVDAKWESGQGHALAAARYGSMSWAPASEVPKPQPGDMRPEAMRQALHRYGEPREFVRSDYVF